MKPGSSSSDLLFSIDAGYRLPPRPPPPRLSVGFPGDSEGDDGVGGDRGRVRRRPCGLLSGELPGFRGFYRCCAGAAFSDARLVAYRHYLCQRAGFPRSGRSAACMHASIGCMHARMQGGVQWETPQPCLYFRTRVRFMYAASHALQAQTDLKSKACRGTFPRTTNFTAPPPPPSFFSRPVPRRQDSNLKPLNWRDAMVSMKPGSGTIGIDPDLDDYAGTPADVERRRLRRSGMMKRRMAEAEGARKPPGVAPPSPEMPRTRYGGPPPGTHGPWRWGQLVKGSALERVSPSCVGGEGRRRQVVAHLS